MGARRAWELGATGALVLVLAAVGGGFFYRAQLNRGLVEAVAARNLDGARRLLDRGADPNLRYGPDNIPILMIAANYNSLDVTRLLLEHGARVDAQAKGGDTALIEAASTADVPVVSLLLEHGAAVNAVDSTGLTPLLAVAWRCRPENLRVLLRHGADPQAICSLGNAVKMAERGPKRPSHRVSCSETLAVLAQELPRK